MQDFEERGGNAGKRTEVKMGEAESRQASDGGQPFSFVNSSTFQRRISKRDGKPPYVTMHFGD